MKKQFLTLLTTAFSFIALNAQISITAADFPDIGEISISVGATANPSITIGSAGANQTYDFSALVATDSFMTTFVDPASTPGSSTYPTATIATDSEGSFTYIQETASEAFVLGTFVDTSSNNSGQFVAVPFSPTQKILEFPSTFNTSYTDNYAIALTIEDDSGFADSIRVTNSTVTDVLFDGYGTVITPDGSYSGLRERTYSTATNLTEALVNGFWITINSSETMDTSYAWYAKEANGPIVNVGIVNGEISGISYTAIDAMPLAPVASFEASEQSPGTFQFNDLSTNVPTTWQWDFGDGNMSSEQNPQHTYATPGEYNVCLTVSNMQGSNQACTTIQVEFAPVAGFNFTDQGGGVVDFEDTSTNSPQAWSWNFGDGNTDTAQNPQHTYTEAGIFNVCLTVTNGAGTDEFCTDVTIVLAPAAAFTFTDQGEGVVDFEDASTNSPDTWLWDFGDGNTSTMQDPQHTFATFGTYNVCLTATNSAGSNTSCNLLTIVLTPAAAFTFMDLGEGVVDFEDASTNNPDAWSWDFGDSNMSTEQNPQHTFSTTGSFNVCLTATNSAGSNTICQDVVIMISSVESIEHLVALQIGPNPVKEVLELEYQSETFHQLQFQLINAQGQIVLEQLLQNKQRHRINMRQLPEGLYYYNLRNQLGQLGRSGSIVKTHTSF